MNKELIQTEGGVCAAKGFKATGLVVGIKKLDSTKKDMAMIYSDVVCKAAGTFTSILLRQLLLNGIKKSSQNQTE